MANFRRFVDAAEEPLENGSPIASIANQPLISFDDAVRKFQPLVTTLDKLVNEAKANQFDPTDSLTADEAAAICLYTLEQADPHKNVCTQLNRALRSTTRDELKPWLSYFKLFITALEKLPAFQGTVYRGVRGNVDDRYETTMTWWAFSSCTESVNTIEEFFDQSDVHTIFEIACVNGRAIRDYSYHKDQNEVVLMPGACLRFIEKRNPAKGTHVMRFEEIPSEYGSSLVSQHLSPPIVKTSISGDSEQVDEGEASLTGKLANSNENKEPSSVVHKGKANDIPVFPSPHQRTLPHAIQMSIPHDPSSNAETLNRLIGSLIGLAVGDALGASVEFRSHAYLMAHPVKQMQSGGTWGLKAGQWTDDTSMALCLASSLISKQAFDPYDQLVRYKWWYKHGFLSSVGHCFDIGSATRRALDEFSHRQKLLKKHFRCRTDADVDQLAFDDVRRVQGFSVNCSAPNIAGNGALMRLAPVPLFYFRSPSLAVDYAGRSAVITHGDRKAVDACRYYAALIVAAVNNEPKEKLLSERFYDEHKNWFQSQDLHPDILRVAQGSYKQSTGYEGGIRGKGYIVQALEAALWAFWSDDGSFETGVLAAIQLGDDTDTTAAIYGQLAGAFYGIDKIPPRWREQLYAHRLIVSMSHWLHLLGAQSSAAEQ